LYSHLARQSRVYHLHEKLYYKVMVKRFKQEEMVKKKIAKIILPRMGIIYNMTISNSDNNYSNK